MLAKTFTEGNEANEGIAPLIFVSFVHFCENGKRARSRNRRTIRITDAAPVAADMQPERYRGVLCIRLVGQSDHCSRQQI